MSQHKLGVPPADEGTTSQRQVVLDMRARAAEYRAYRPNVACQCEPSWHAEEIERWADDLAAALSPSEGPTSQPKMNKQRAGLYRKFDVRRTDGSDAPGGKHDGCSYFVLDLTHDPYAMPALRAYAEACGEKYPALSADLRSIVEGKR